MKKLILLTFLGTALCSFAQETTSQPTTNKRHEIRLDATDAIAVPGIDLNYEYLWRKSTTFGLAGYVRFNEDSRDLRLNYAITPYFRQYFNSDKESFGRGFFGEANIRYSIFQDEITTGFQGNNRETKDTYADAFGVGFAIGYKFVSANGFVVELSIGPGRNLYQGDTFTSEFYGRGGVFIGYRF